MRLRKGHDNLRYRTCGHLCIFCFTPFVTLPHSLTHSLINSLYLYVSPLTRNISRTHAHRFKVFWHPHTHTHTHTHTRTHARTHKPTLNLLSLARKAYLMSLSTLLAFLALLRSLSHTSKVYLSSKKLKSICLYHKHLSVCNTRP